MDFLQCHAAPLNLVFGWFVADHFIDIDEDQNPDNSVCHHIHRFRYGFVRVLKIISQPVQKCVPNCNPQNGGDEELHLSHFKQAGRDRNKAAKTRDQVCQENSCGLMAFKKTGNFRNERRCSCSSTSCITKIFKIG